jgi:hypothetical protein
MKQKCLRISLAATVFLLCGQLGFAVPQNGPTTSSGAQPSPASAALSYPDTPSAVKTSGAPDSDAEKARFRGAPPTAKGPLIHKFDVKYVLVMSMMFAASIVDVEKTNTCLQEHTCSFVPATFRSRAALYGAGIPAEVGVAYVSYRLKERKHRWWILPAVVVTAANAYVAHHAAGEPSHSRTSK